jgi:hypothetical protein
MSNSKNTASLDITHESLSEYLRNRYPNRSFDDFSRLLGELVDELRSGGFSTIGDVHKTLERIKKAAELFEAENPPSKNMGSRYSAIGIVKISISLLDNDFFIDRPDILDNCSLERLEEYRKHILPETD